MLACWSKAHFNQHLTWIFQILHWKQLLEAARRLNKTRYDSFRRSFLERVFHAKNAACMNELWKLGFITHGIPGLVGNCWRGETDRWTLYTGRKQWPSTALPASSGSRFPPFGWADSAWTSEVHVTWSTVCRHLQMENQKLSYSMRWWEQHRNCLCIKCLLCASSFMHLSSFHPSTTFCVRNCCVHFMGKEMETKRGY